MVQTSFLPFVFTLFSFQKWSFLTLLGKTFKKTLITAVLKQTPDPFSNILRGFGVLRVQNSLFPGGKGARIEIQDLRTSAAQPPTTSIQKKKLLIQKKT